MEEQFTTFLNMVRRMRNVQQSYFRTRDYNAMLESKKYEGMVDKFIADFDRRQKCPELFEAEELPF